MESVSEGCVGELFFRIFRTSELVVFATFGNDERLRVQFRQHSKSVPIIFFWYG